jgi:LL-diaminopimelate aminotransferase
MSMADCKADCRYGEGMGNPKLRELIAKKLYPNDTVKPTEVYISDGSKCDIGRLQMMFGAGLTVAAQVPYLSHPA